MGVDLIPAGHSSFLGVVALQLLVEGRQADPGLLPALQAQTDANLGSHIALPER